MTSVYRYPLKAFTDKTDYLQIGVVEYTPIGKDETIEIGETITEGGKVRFGTELPKIGTKKSIKTKSLTSNPEARRNTKRVKETILLPIPASIQDGLTVSYGENSLNSIVGAAVGGVMGIMEAGAEGNTLGKVAESVKKAGSNALNSLGSTVGMDDLRGFATRSLASQALKIFNANITPNQILARQEGRILNPNMELLFNGPTLRSFRFSFKMTSRNREESIQIRNIIRCFKKNMVPRVDTDKNLFLSTPNVFELTYRQGSREHSFLHKFKQCFLQDISVNYTGEGSYLTYGDGTPVSMIMDLTFKEIQPIYSSDYEHESSGTGVGY